MINGIYNIVNIRIPIEKIIKEFEMLFFLSSKFSSVHKNLKTASVTCNVKIGAISGKVLINKSTFPKSSLVKKAVYRGSRKKARSLDAKFPIK